MACISLVFLTVIILRTRWIYLFFKNFWNIGFTNVVIWGALSQLHHICPYLLVVYVKRYCGHLVTFPSTSLESSDELGGALFFYKNWRGDTLNMKSMYKKGLLNSKKGCLPRLGPWRYKMTRSTLTLWDHWNPIRIVVLIVS